MAITISENSAIKTVIGPVHPAFKEPIKFAFEIEGEVVTKVDLQPGHTHRGMEWMGSRRNAVQIVHLAERICGICSISHALCFAMAVEEAINIEVPVRGQYVGTIFAELERIRSHILWAGVAALELGFDTLFYKTWEVRENLLDLIEEISGNRVNYGMVQVGGTRRDITPDKYSLIDKSLSYYENIFEDLGAMFLEDTVIKARCQHTGVLTKQEALDLQVVGHMARASGVNMDVRQDAPYLAYADLTVKAQTPDLLSGVVNGDIFDRIIVRLLEIKQSIGIIRECVEKMPDGEYNAFPKVTKLLNTVRKGAGEGIGRHEAPRGEAVHYVRYKAKQETPEVWKAKASTYSNLMSWQKMLLGEQIADIPVIIASLDPCISCTDRVAITKNGRTSILTQKEFRKLSVEKTRKMQK